MCAQTDGGSWVMFASFPSWQGWYKFFLCSLWLVSSLSAFCLRDSRHISHLVLLSSSSLGVKKSWLCDKNLNRVSSDALAQTRPPPEEISRGSFVSLAAVYGFLLISHSNSLCALLLHIWGGRRERMRGVQFVCRGEHEDIVTDIFSFGSL